MTIKVIPLEQPDKYVSVHDLEDGHAYIDSEGDLVLCLSVRMGETDEYATKLWYPHDDEWYDIGAVSSGIRYREVNVEIAVKG